MARFPQDGAFCRRTGRPDHQQGEAVARQRQDLRRLRSRLPADQHRLPARNPDRGTGADSGCDEKQIKPHR